MYLQRVQIWYKSGANITYQRNFLTCQNVALQELLQFVRFCQQIVDAFRAKRLLDPRVSRSQHGSRKV